MFHQDKRLTEKRKARALREYNSTWPRNEETLQEDEEQRCQDSTYASGLEINQSIEKRGNVSLKRWNWLYTCNIDIMLRGNLKSGESWR